MTSFGEILKSVGDFGRFQKCLVLMVSLSSFLAAFPLFGQMFMVLHVPHHCDTNWIREIGPNMTKEEQLNLTIPRSPPGSYEECQMYTPVEKDIDSILKYGLNATEKCRKGWVYPAEQEQTLVTQFDLVCDRKELSNISQSILMLGFLLGAVISGTVSDRIGRRPVALLSLLVMGAFGVGTAFAPNFYIYMALRCIVGAAVSSVSLSMVTLGTEWVGVSYRAHSVTLGNSAVPVGQIALAGVAYGIRNWKLLQIAGSAPVFGLLFYIWILPESARWLVTKGKSEEAKTLLQKAACVNNRRLPPELLNQLTCEKKNKSGNVLDLFRKQQQRNVILIMFYIWQSSLGLCSMSSRVGGILSPLIGLLDKYHPSVSMVIFGSTSVIAGTLCFLLTETCGKELQDHMEAAVASQRSCENVMSNCETGSLKLKEDGQDTGHTRSTHF
ncbi:solute carrier family 22 member 13-like isoform X5 [Carettochelys insculpta]|uniref:solute carrier family 22 member 13-like isoform X5 n=1 Tax=Carettochelys insculpta TaxID=44489 RepID=UPI003EB6A435